MNNNSESSKKNTGRVVEGFSEPEKVEGIVHENIDELSNKETVEFKKESLNESVAYFTDTVKNIFNETNAPENLKSLFEKHNDEIVEFIDNTDDEKMESDWNKSLNILENEYRKRLGEIAVIAGHDSFIDSVKEKNSEKGYHEDKEEIYQKVKEDAQKSFLPITELEEMEVKKNHIHSELRAKAAEKISEEPEKAEQVNTELETHLSIISEEADKREESLMGKTDNTENKEIENGGNTDDAPGEKFPDSYPPEDERESIKEIPNSDSKESDVEVAEDEQIKIEDSEEDVLEGEYIEANEEGFENESEEGFGSYGSDDIENKEKAYQKIKQIFSEAQNKKELEEKIKFVNKTLSGNKEKALEGIASEEERKKIEHDFYQVGEEAKRYAEERGMEIEIIEGFDVKNFENDIQKKGWWGNFKEGRDSLSADEKEYYEDTATGTNSVPEIAEFYKKTGSEMNKEWGESRKVQKENSENFWKATGANVRNATTKTSKFFKAAPEELLKFPGTAGHAVAKIGMWGLENPAKAAALMGASYGAFWLLKTALVPYLWLKWIVKPEWDKAIKKK